MSERLALVVKRLDVKGMERLKYLSGFDKVQMVMVYLPDVGKCDVLGAPSQLLYNLCLWRLELL